MKDETIFIVAGGTGGHINAALALGDHFKSKEVIYVSGKRYLDYQLYDKKKCIHFNAKPLKGRNIISTCTNSCRNLFVFLQMIVLVLKENPSFVIGAGGYICGPTLLAAKILNKKIFILEQNSVAGITNKILAKIANKIFTSFTKTQGLCGPNIILSGNPIRSEINFSKNIVRNNIKILVCGGSLGAAQVNEAIFELLKKTNDIKLEVMHQVGKNNILKQKYDFGDNIYKSSEYITNMGEEYSKANIIIARAGASTISELRVIKKPAILIPYPGASHNHQVHNANNLKEEEKFHVEVVDNNLNKFEMSNVIYNHIQNIIKNNLFDSEDSEVQNPCNIIEKEIKKCMA